MPVPVKPETPVLQAGHDFAQDLVGAWLFVEGTNNTIADWSGLGHHMSGEDVVPTPEWIFSDAIVGWSLGMNANIFQTAASHSDFNHTSAQPWTQIFWLRRNGGHSGTFARLSWRPLNVVDLAVQVNGGFRAAYFDGSAWVNPAEGSNVSGQNEMWAFVYDGTDMKIYKGSDQNPGVTCLDTRNKSMASTGHLKFFGNGGEDLTAYIHGVFYHRAALDADTLASHFDEPWEAFTEPEPDPPNNDPIAAQPGTVWLPGMHRREPDFRLMPLFNGRPLRR